MNQSEKPKFEQQWQRAFESAAETPPPAAWDAIEERLDGQETAVVPLLWWKNPKVWYAAAAVAALLLVSWPMLESYNSESDQAATQQAAKEPSSSPLSNEAEVPNVASSDSEASAIGTLGGTESKADERIAEAKKTSKVPSVTLPSAAKKWTERIANNADSQPDKAAAGGSFPTISTASPALAEVPTGAKALDKQEGLFNQKAGLSSTAPPLALRTPTIIEITQSTRRIPAGAEASDRLSRVIMGSSKVPLRTKALTQPIAALSPADELAELDVYFQRPLVRRDLAIFENTAAARPRHSRVREFWAGLSLMPALFNPQMNVTSPPRAFANANASRQSLSNNASQAQLSYAVQAQAGKQLSKHWSIESGLSYLWGNSTFVSDGYVLDAVTSQSANVLEDALISNSAGFYLNAKSPVTTSSMDLSAGSYIDFDQRTTNDYRYVQLPVQAGYTLNPDGKLNYTVLGGVMANLFLQNEIATKSGEVFANTADDGLYKALNWSAATGVRVNYRLGDHWNASLTGTYQKAIASILKGDGVLNSQPQLYGMAWGVRYVF